MSTKNMLSVYHVTPAENKASILMTSIDPAYSRGLWQVCWFVDHARIAWAMLHVASESGHLPTDLIIFHCCVNAWRLKRTLWRGVYRCAYKVFPASSWGGSEMISELQPPIERRKNPLGVAPNPLYKEPVDDLPF